jgi:site-specific DNA-cytosine methylase
MQGGHREPKVLVKSIQVGTVNKGGQGDRIYSPEGKGISLTAQSGGTAGNGNMLIVGGAFRGRYQEDGSIKQELEIRSDEKTNTVTTVQKDNVVISNATYRKLTCLECERLMTVPDNYTEGVSNTQRYKMLGNGWSVDVIKHIFSNAIWT